MDGLTFSSTVKRSGKNWHPKGWTAPYELQLNFIHEHLVPSQSGNGNTEQQNLNTHAYPWSCLHVYRR